MTTEELERIVRECDNPSCTRYNGRCIGYHCPRCGAPCSSHGHFNCPGKPKASA